jgi:hypothetical protein
MQAMSLLPRLALRIGIVLTLGGVAVNIAKPQAKSHITAPCSDVLVFGDQPISAQPKNIQMAIRAAIRPDIHAIVNDPGMGMIDAKVDSVPLNVVKIPRAVNAGSLFIVSWDDGSFGVNGAVWIVEMTPHGARNITQSRASQLRGFSPGGFGVASISPANERYPELMFASKGFKTGGGAEAEETCVRRVGANYQDVSCPTTCHQALNAR